MGRRVAVSGGGVGVTQWRAYVSKRRIFPLKQGLFRETKRIFFGRLHDF